MSSSVSLILDKIAPQFASDSDKTFFISLAQDQTSLVYYGANTSYAIALRTAHLMVLRDRSVAGASGGGELASKREGDLAVSFHKSATAGSIPTDLDLTSYGKQLLGLTAGSGVAVAVTGGNDDGV